MYLTISTRPLAALRQAGMIAGLVALGVGLLLFLVRAGGAVFDQQLSLPLLAGFTLVAALIGGFYDLYQSLSPGRRIVTVGEDWMEIAHGLRAAHRLRFSRLQHAELSNDWNSVWRFELEGKPADTQILSEAGFSRSDWVEMCLALLPRLEEAGVPCVVKDESLANVHTAAGLIEDIDRLAERCELYGGEDELARCLAQQDWAEAKEWIERMEVGLPGDQRIPAMARLLAALRRGDSSGAFFEIHDGHGVDTEAADGVLTRALAMELRQCGKSEMAALLLEELDEDEDDDDDDRQNHLRAVANAGIRYYRELGAESADDAVLLKSLIEWLQCAEQRNKALQAAERLAELPDQKPNAIILQASLLREHNPAEALRRLDAIASVYQAGVDGAEIAEARGLVLESMGELNGARAAYEKSVRLDSKSTARIWLELLDD